ncbi:DUF11 domain-containing protein [Conexibacter woesei]|uniref:DUF11 domain-containing protein n=1 Tax=Conexibacter woesei TaxID=191495 RepID=UPI0004212D5F|nr:DUF11 domain-containing protein [Conexibacter woesei]
MSTLSRRRGVVSACVALLCAFGLLLAAGSARADPGTNGLLTVSDTTPTPGETITVSWDVTYTGSDFAGQIGKAHNYLGLDKRFSGGPYGDLSFVTGSCTGDLSSCTVNPTANTFFRGEVPRVTAFDQTRSGTAQFVVSAGATLGETINLNAVSTALNADGSGTSVIFVPLPITVTAPAADLGVSLSATPGPPLHGRVDYDAAVTNNGPDPATAATLTTQLPWQATGISAAGSCTYTSATDQVSCPVGAVANGTTTHVTFTVQYGLLSIGALTATSTLSAVTPTDSNAANDSSSATCHALTGPLISC